MRHCVYLLKPATGRRSLLDQHAHVHVHELTPVSASGGALPYHTAPEKLRSVLAFLHAGYIFMCMDLGTSALPLHVAPASCVYVLTAARPHRGVCACKVFQLIIRKWHLMAAGPQLTECSAAGHALWLLVLCGFNRPPDASGLVPSFEDGQRRLPVGQSRDIQRQRCWTHPGHRSYRMPCFRPSTAPDPDPWHTGTYLRCPRPSATKGTLAEVAVSPCEQTFGMH